MPEEYLQTIAADLGTTPEYLRGETDIVTPPRETDGQTADVTVDDMIVFHRDGKTTKLKMSSDRIAAIEKSLRFSRTAGTLTICKKEKCMNDSKKALLIFGGLAAVVIIVVGVMMSKTAFWLVGLLALLGIIIAAAAASDGGQKSDAPLREDEILDPDERFGFAFAVKVVGVSFPNDDPKAPHRQAVLREAFEGGGVLDDDPDSRYVPGACAGTAIRAAGTACRHTVRLHRQHRPGRPAGDPASDARCARHSACALQRF